MQVDFKTDGKNLKKNLLRKNQKNRAFSTPCENSAGLAKIPNIISQGVQNFSHPAKSISQGMRKICTPSFAKNCTKLKNVQTHFATLEKFRKPCVNSNSLCKNQRSLKSLFKPLQALFSFRTPHLPIVQASVTLRCPNFHSFLSIGRPVLTHLKRRPTPNLWNTDPSLSLGRLDLRSLILEPLSILSVLPACHRKPSSNELWSPRRPLREIQIVEPDHSSPSYILTLRSCDSSTSFKIHLDCSKGTISSTL